MRDEQCTNFFSWFILEKCEENAKTFGWTAAAPNTSVSSDSFRIWETP